MHFTGTAALESSGAAGCRQGSNDGDALHPIWRGGAGGRGQGDIDGDAWRKTFSRSKPTSRLSSIDHFSPFLDHNKHFHNYDHEVLSGQHTQSPHPSTAADVGTCNAVASKKALTEDMAPRFGHYPEDLFRQKQLYGGDGRRTVASKKALTEDTARNFFTVHDMLGFDKISETVDWLLTKSKAIIKQPVSGLSQTEGCGNDSTRGANSASKL